MKRPSLVLLFVQGVWFGCAPGVLQSVSRSEITHVEAEAVSSTTQDSTAPDDAKVPHAETDPGGSGTGGSGTSGDNMDSGQSDEDAPPESSPPPSDSQRRGAVGDVFQLQGCEHPDHGELPGCRSAVAVTCTFVSTTAYFCQQPGVVQGKVVVWGE